MKTNLKKICVSFAGFAAVAVSAAVFVLNNQFDAAYADVRNTEEIRYYDGVSAYASSEKETVAYTSREEDYEETVNAVPSYFNSQNLENACAPVAGAIVVGFYDKYFEELIPNFTGYFPATGKYKPNDRTYVPQLMRDMYGYMKTNVVNVGSSERECREGLNDYCNDKGYSASYSSIGSSGALNLSAYLNAIRNNKPVILFASNADLYFVGLGDNQDNITITHMDGNHVFVGFGYYVVRYYNGSGNFRTDTYLRVEGGRFDIRSTLIKVASTASTVSNAWFNSGYAVTVN